MERTIDIITRRALEREVSADATIILVTISHAALDETIRLAGDGADWEFGGQTYHKGGFELTLVTDNDSPPTARFTFPNVKRPLMSRLETMTDAAEVTFEAVSSAYYDIMKEPRIAKSGMTPVAFYTARHLYLTDIEITADTVTGTLHSRDYRQEIWPGRRATPELTPGVWP